jgi:hypothetical protein
VFTQPFHELLALGAQCRGGLERRAAVAGGGVDVHASCQQQFGGTALAAAARLEERLRQRLHRRGRLVEQVEEPVVHAERRGMPELVHSGTPVDQEPGHVPAAVSDGVVQGSR